MSKTTSSPSLTSCSPGSACGRAPFGPEATIAGKDGSPPSSRIRASVARAMSRSLRPPRPRSRLQRQTSSAISEAAAIASSSRGVLHPPQLLDVPAGGDELDSIGQFLLEPLHRPDREVLVLEPGPAREARGDPTQPVVLDGDGVPAVDLGLGALRVSEVGQEQSRLRAAHAGSVGAGEAGQVTDVDHLGDDHEVELALGDEPGEAVASLRAHGSPSSSRAIVASASR